MTSVVHGCSRSDPGGSGDSLRRLDFFIESERFGIVWFGIWPPERAGRHIRYHRTWQNLRTALYLNMLPPEFILFLLLDSMVLVWITFEVLVNHVIESDPPPPARLPAEPSEHLRRAA